MTVAVTIVVVTIVTVALMALWYWGVMYDAPGWNSHAFPPAIAH